MSSRKCLGCGQEKDFSEFRHYRAKLKEGSESKPRSRCKECECKYTQEYTRRPGVREHRWETRKAQRASDIKYKIQDRIATWRKQTPDSDLSVDYLVGLWNKQQGLCYYTGIPMNWNSAGIESDCFSLDKLNPKIGYMKGNVVFCRYVINTMKWNRSEEEFYDCMMTILRHREKL